MVINRRYKEAATQITRTASLRCAGHSISLFTDSKEKHYGKYTRDFIGERFPGD
jgi:hypothetical protein